MDSREIFTEAFKQPLSKLLIELSQSNIGILSSEESGIKSEIVDRILRSNYYTTSVKYRGNSYDCHCRHELLINEEKSQDFMSLDPVCLGPIPNENYFYCRGNLTEATKGRYDLIIPSRDYSSHSYEWKDLYSVLHTDKVFSILLKRLSRQSLDHQKYRIHLFGLLADQQRSYTQLLSTKALKNLCSESTAFKQMCESENFEFFALAQDTAPKGSVETRRNSPQVIESAIDQEVKALRKEKHKRLPTTYVIFVDSLDSSIFENEDTLEKLPSLKNLFKKSLFYKNFTSSGFWTFPCLHALQTGIPPKYSSSFIKLDPAIKINLQKKLLKPDNSSMFDSFGYCSYTLSDIRPKSLTRIIRDAGMKTASIKSSSVNSSYWNLQEGINISIENSTIDLIPYHLKQIKNQNDNDLSVIFIDIDTLHRGPLFYKDKATDWGVDEINFIHRQQSKRNRLLGIRDTSFDELARELSQLKKVDMILHDILEQTTDEDNIILFSDNGSQNQPATIPSNIIEFVPESSGTIEKIWRPTLIVRSNKFSEKAGTLHELVSTSDIYSIVLHACGLETKVDSEDLHLDSILPTSLGGKEARKVAETFGLNTQNCLIVEWVKRYGNSRGDYRAINMTGRSLKPIIELINELESKFTD